MGLEEQAYHDYPAWSYSMIAKYAKQGFSAISRIHQHTTPTPEMEFGSLLDSILTRGKKTFEEYVIDDGSANIPPAEKAVFDTILSEGFRVPYADLHQSVLEKAIESCDSFCSKYKKPETRLQKLKETSGYYELARTGKKIVSREDFDDAFKLAQTLVRHPFTSTIFGTKNTKDIEYIYQSQFLVDWTLPSGKTVKIKIMPDLLVVNHAKKTIRPVDLKHMSLPGYTFKENFLNLRYDIQASEYTDVLQKVIDGDSDYQDYTILPYYFAVISRSDMVPVVYEYDPRSESQKDGLSFKQFHYKNWKDLLDEILVYEETHAVVPSNMTTEAPNDLLTILES